tara:strand:+ start:515 stop:1087 length:573 start_codon:yes stop_codon:yes gene_type:complete
MNDMTNNQQEKFMGLTHAQVFMYLLMTVISITFLFITNAYLFRMNFADWQSLPMPTLLWFNTGALVLASVGLIWSKQGAKSGNLINIKIGLIAAGIFGALFTIGQATAWQELNAVGYFIASNPANTFFYLITALHVMHILGGMVAWVRVSFKVFSTSENSVTEHTLGLLGIYWHYMLLVWVLLFSILLTT